MSVPPDFPNDSSQPEFNFQIPRKLWSFETDEPFRNCLICSSDLITNPSLYFINKCFLDSETIFEMALCLNCHQHLRSELSQSSLNRIQNYLEEYQIEPRLNPNHGENAFEEQISNCLIKRRPSEPGEEIQIIAYCQGPELVRHIPAMMLCWEAVQDMENLLSKETRDVMDGFTETYFGPPSGAKKPKWVPI